MLAALNAEIERLKVQRDAALEKVNLLEWANGKLGRQVVEFSEEVNCRGERITVTIAALRETREALEQMIGVHVVPGDCFSTGPFHGDVRDELCVACAAKAVLAKYADLAGEAPHA